MRKSSIGILALMLVIGLASVGVISGMASANAGDGFTTSDGGHGVGGVMVTAPGCANPGDVVSITVTYPVVDPTLVIVRLRQPTTDPATYPKENKVNIRQANLATTGSAHNFYIDTWTQIGGKARVRAIVDGVGNDTTSFEIPCP